MRPPCLNYADARTRETGIVGVRISVRAAPSRKTKIFSLSPSGGEGRGEGESVPTIPVFEIVLLRRGDLQFACAGIRPLTPTLSPAGERERFLSPRPVQLQPLQPAVRPPILKDLHERNRSRTIGPIARRARRKLAFVVVVPRRAFLEELLPQDRQRLDGLHPILFRLFRGFDGAHLPFAAGLHD